MSFGIKRDRADILFSLYIRNRDSWTCVRCKRQHPEGAATLGNSHFYGRRNESTRFEPDNCDSLCNMPCHHKWGGDDRMEYREFKLKQLGKKRYDQLVFQAQSYKKKDRKMRLLEVKALVAASTKRSSTGAAR
jgi:hypothetical protein